MKQIALLHEYAHALMARALGVKGHIEEVEMGYVFLLEEDAPAWKVGAIAIAPFIFLFPLALAVIRFFPFPDLGFILAVIITLLGVPSEGDEWILRKAIRGEAKTYSELLLKAIVEEEEHLAELRDEYLRITGRTTLYGE